MLQPKRVKFRKTHRGRRQGKAQAGTEVSFGEFGMQALESAWVTSNQIEAARRAITRHVRRGGKVWIRIFPDKPVTKKPAETRMGGGKGLVDHWVAVVKAGRMMFELGGVGEKVARESIRLASHKLPLKTKFVARESIVAGAETKVGVNSMKMDEFRALTPADLGKQLEDAHQELFNLRFRLATRQLVNHREIRRVKRKIARLNTVKQERELGIR